MTQPPPPPEPAANQPNTQAATTFLKPEEAQILLDWARSEEKNPAGTSPPAAASSPSERVRSIVKEIDDLVGNRQTLVADDMEERMIALLVGQLDPKSQICLEISRDVAQVTAEKDHLAGPELVRRLTTIASKTFRLIAGTQSLDAPSTPPNATASNTTTPNSTSPAPSSALAPASVAARTRPIPRPSKILPSKPTLLQRLLGGK